MAIRPAWRVREDNTIVKEEFSFEFHRGLAPIQKQRNIIALHEQIPGKTLEVSTKSFDLIGNKLSAFNLKLGGIHLECVYQGSKKYENGGPYTDLFTKSPREAKNDERHKISGRILGYEYKDIYIPYLSGTIFYDWLYFCAVKESVNEEEFIKILQYDYFTDIEFAPSRSRCTQAKSIAIIKSILQKGISLKSIESFNMYEKYYNEIKAEQA